MSRRIVASTVMKRFVNTVCVVWRAGVSKHSSSYEWHDPTDPVLSTPWYRRLVWRTLTPEKCSVYRGTLVPFGRASYISRSHTYEATSGTRI